MLARREHRSWKSAPAHRSRTPPRDAAHDNHGDGPASGVEGRGEAGVKVGGRPTPIARPQRVPCLDPLAGERGTTSAGPGRCPTEEW